MAAVTNYFLQNEFILLTVLIDIWSLKTTSDTLISIYFFTWSIMKKLFLIIVSKIQIYNWKYKTKTFQTNELGEVAMNKSVNCNIWCCYLQVYIQIELNLNSKISYNHIKFYMLLKPIVLFKTKSTDR